MMAAGPGIGASNTNTADEYEALGIARLRPTFIEYPRELKTLPAVRSISDPQEASTSLPEIVSILFETPAVEPALQFDAFIRGAAVVALMIDPERIGQIKTALQQVAERVINGADLPPVDEHFRQPVALAERTIFGNSEPMSWSRLLAFAQGAYWLLSFIEAPQRKRGKHSPMQFVEILVNHWAVLAYLPT